MARRWTGRATVWNDVSGAVDNAAGWAEDRLEDAGNAIVDVGKSTVKALSFGLLG